MFIFKYKSSFYISSTNWAVSIKIARKNLFFLVDKSFKLSQSRSNLCNLLEAQTPKGLHQEKKFQIPCFFLQKNHTICLSHYQVWILPFAGKEQKHSCYGQIIWEPVHTQKYSMFLLPQKSKNPLGLLKPSLSDSWISVLDLGHDRLQALIQRAEGSACYWKWTLR